jgi:arginyl-tRNA synthetase
LAAFQKAYPSENINLDEIEITRTNQDKFGHYQCNSAMKFSKKLKSNPRDIALKVQTALLETEDSSLEKVEIAGPGFINVTLSTTLLNQYCQEMLNRQHCGILTDKPQKIIIDFSSPNTAKEMHVGHLRSTIIGDCLARLFETYGHHVVRLNHIGDWGTAFGMLIAYIKQHARELLSDWQKVELSQLVTAYKAAKALFDSSAEFKKESQLEVVRLQNGDPQALNIWQFICEISRRAYQEIYHLLDVKLIERGESFYNNYLADVISDLEEKNLITISEGAKCLFLPGFTNREGEPLPFMLQKSDGGYNYATTDMAALKHRIEVEKAQRIIYVTDSGQATHFAMLFAAGEKAGYLDPAIVRVDHVPFGLVLGPDGKKFKTRSGDTEKLIDLLNTAITKANDILHERNMTSSTLLADNVIQDIAKKLGINAVKYADLSCNRISDYVFSYDRMLRFEGNTAAFLMYAFVRIHGIKRKIAHPEIGHIQLEHPSEIDLGLYLAQFSDVLNAITEDLLPNRLCDYLYELAQKFNAFFRDCRVQGSLEQNQRLALCALTEKVLREGMTILGLQTVTRM